MPGMTGLAIAGLWYLLLALASPAVALTRRIRGGEPRWRAAGRATWLGVAMLAAFVATGLAAGKALSATFPDFVERGSRITSPSLSLRVFGVVLLILVAVLGFAMTSAVRYRYRRARNGSSGRVQDSPRSVSERLRQVGQLQCRGIGNPAQQALNPDHV